METKLKIPFDFNPSGGNSSLTVYAPETKDCESANIKRGLINILEFYDSNAKTISKISELSSSGNCSETVHTESESDTEVNLVRTLDFSKGCQSELSHKKYRLTHMSESGTYCVTKPEPIRSNVTTKVTKSKDGSDTPKIFIKKTERLKLVSVLPASGLFDNLISQTVLELKEVRDATPEVTLSGSPSQSSTEYKLLEKLVKNEEQPNYVTGARESFKKLKESLKKLNTNPHLEDQEAASVMLDVNFKLFLLKRDSLNTLYKELDDELKSAFFQILGLTGSEEAIDAVKDILLEEHAANNVNIYNQAASFYENLDGKYIRIKKGNELLLELLPKVQAMPSNPSRDRLRNAIALKFAAIHDIRCLRYPVRTDCMSKEALWETRHSFNLNDFHEKILFMRLLGMWRIPQGVPWLIETILDKANPINLRVQATWVSLVFLSQYPGNLTETMTQLFYDRTEDHEIRIYALMLILWKDKETKHLQYLIDNQDNEDRQLISFIFSYLRMRANKPERKKTRSTVLLFLFGYNERALQKVRRCKQRTRTQRYLRFGCISNQLKT